MNKNFIGILAVALLVVGGLVWYSVHENQAHLLTLKGTVLKVRTLPLDATSTLAIVDFQVTNPTTVPFSVEDVELEMDPKGPAKTSDTHGDAKAKPEAQPIKGGIFESRDLAEVFEYAPKVGPKEHNRIAAGDTIAAGQTTEFMVGASMPLPQADVDARGRFRIRLQDFNGPVVEIVETQTAH